MPKTNKMSHFFKSNKQENDTFLASTKEMLQIPQSVDFDRSSRNMHVSLEIPRYGTPNGLSSNKHASYSSNHITSGPKKLKLKKSRHKKRIKKGEQEPFKKLKKNYQPVRQTRRQLRKKHLGKLKISSSDFDSTARREEEFKITQSVQKFKDQDTLKHALGQLTKDRDNGLILHKQLQVLKILEHVFFTPALKKLIPYVLLEIECKKVAKDREWVKAHKTKNKKVKPPKEPPMTISTAFNKIFSSTTTCKAKLEIEKFVLKNLPPGIQNSEINQGVSQA